MCMDHFSRCIGKTTKQDCDSDGEAELGMGSGVSTSRSSKIKMTKQEVSLLAFHKGNFRNLKDFQQCSFDIL